MSQIHKSGIASWNEGLIKFTYYLPRRVVRDRFLSRRFNSSLKFEIMGKPTRRLSRRHVSFAMLESGFSIRKAAGILSRDESLRFYFV